ncbi:rhophilin-1 [Hemicordylus capensis]|uniref:rhophilin-1 n=1 Tax=Hemicordylus capensis TaxID=884348 RepID=UPI0023034FEF|nr:rhophilin-1 [Hemicordylus capensis]XP_053107120.1 rhophilin-1 [Hemicordylus capensis]
MIPEEESPPGVEADGDGEGGFPLLLEPSESGSVRKGCDPLAQTQRSKLQHRRARINQQINKEMRMRAGAENLFRATSNHKVKETVALELSYVNSNLQLLKEELEELNSCMDVYQNDSDSISVPMIPLGLKETKELDWATPLKEMIWDHYGEDGALYETEIRELVELRQAMRTPSRNEAGLELLMEYYSQLYFLDNRFFPSNKNLVIFFHWYDSLTGVPSHQRALAFEKGSVLFNIGALHTQIGARQDRTTLQGVDCAIEAFQKASGAFNYLKENFSNAPSLDMSAPSLNMLVRLMIAQVQECVFEKVVLLRAQSDFLTCLQLAQEAARVEEVYALVYQTMTQPHVKDYVPFSWTTMVHVKSEHFKALSHYYAAIALCDCPPASDADLPDHEKAFRQFHITVPEGPAQRLLLQDQEERRKLGKGHLKKAIMRHEEAMRIHSLCKILRKMDILQEVLCFAHKRSLNKYSEIDHEEDFFETADAPDIHPKTHQRAEIKSPNFSKVKVMDIFHRLGPLSVFSAKNKWHPPRTVHLVRGENGFGFTLRGDSPVLIAGVIAGGCAAEAGLKEGDYIVSVGGKDCRWSKHAEVVQMLKVVGDEGAEVGVITLQYSDGQSTVDKKSSAMSSSGAGGLLKSNKENSRKSRMQSKGASTLLAWGKRSKRSKAGSTSSLPFSAVGDNDLAC